MKQKQKEIIFSFYNLLNLSKWYEAGRSLTVNSEIILVNSEEKIIGRGGIVLTFENDDRKKFYDIEKHELLSDSHFVVVREVCGDKEYRLVHIIEFSDVLINKITEYRGEIITSPQKIKDRSWLKKDN